MPLKEIVKNLAINTIILTGEKVKCTKLGELSEPIIDILMQIRVLRAITFPNSS